MDSRAGSSEEPSRLPLQDFSGGGVHYSVAPLSCSFCKLFTPRGAQGPHLPVCHLPRDTERQSSTPFSFPVCASCWGLNILGVNLLDPLSPLCKVGW